MRLSSYQFLMVAGILASLLFWRRLAGKDPALLKIYFGGLLGAFVGAKIVYLTSEGWMRWHEADRWMSLATGKSVLGALLGGYGGVELAKARIGITIWTGDIFAFVAPVGILMGRIGCLMHGCCLGKVCRERWFSLLDSAGAPRWPAVPVEILFNTVMLGIFFVAWRSGKARGQLFHIYVAAYGGFRFFHEFARATPSAVGPLTGYQLWAVLLTAFGVAAYTKREAEKTFLKLEPSKGNGSAKARQI